MQFNKETFEKALKSNKIVRYQQHFEAVVKSYLELENQALRIHDVVGRSEQCVHPKDKRDYIGSNMLRCKVCGEEFS